MFHRLATVSDTGAELANLFQRTWDDIAVSADGWRSEERIAIASVTREGGDRRSSHVPRALDDAAIAAAGRLADRPAQTDESWVGEVVAALGETRYVGLLGVVAVVCAIDTVTSLMGAGVEPLPAPRDGEARSLARDPNLHRRNTWVSMSGRPVPRNVLSAAPDVHATANRVLDRLYEPALASPGVEPIRELTRSQTELVVISVSLANECFY